MIDEMIELLDLSVNKLNEGKELSSMILAKEVEFCKEFIQRNHEAKEEDVLAAELQKRGFPLDRGPILLMLEGHRKGRAILRRMIAAERFQKKEERFKSFAQYASAYSLYLYEHLREEENQLFSSVKKAIDQKRLEELVAECDKIDKASSQDLRGKYKIMLAEIKKALG